MTKYIQTRREGRFHDQSASVADLDGFIAALKAKAVAILGEADE